MVVRNMWGILSVADAKLVSKYFWCFRRGELVPGAAAYATTGSVPLRAIA